MSPLLCLWPILPLWMWQLWPILLLWTLLVSIEIRLQTQTRDSGVPESLLVGMMVGGLRPDLAAIVIPQLPKALPRLRSVATIAEQTVFEGLCV
jgi:hypothetical protein